MSEEKLLTVRDVSFLLGVSEKEVLDLAQNSSIPAYKVGGVYLRFKKDQVDEYKKSLHHQNREQHQTHYSLKERLADFFYFNDFYLLSFLIILLMLFVILKG
ncbi:MAG: excisionase family DNA-binding protein [Candidatus Omnitrophota bacterium]